MKRENFVTLLMGTTGGILFALGMCMCLVAEWNTFSEGIVCGAVGFAVLLAMVLIRRKMLGKPPVALTRKAAAATALAIVGLLVFGLGLCLCIVREGFLIWGIVVGLLGIVLLLCLIPLCLGLK